MRVSDAGLSLIQAWEGILDGDPSTVLLDPYVCPAGVLTVGWGHALSTPAGQQIRVKVFGHARAIELARTAMIAKFGKPAISREEALALLHSDVAHFENGVSAAVPSDTSQAQFDAMVAFAFNCGLEAFEKSSLRRFHDAGQRQTGQDTIDQLCAMSKTNFTPHNVPESFAAWSHGDGQWLLGLFRRRMSEAMVYGGRTGTQAYQIAQGFHG